MILLPVKSLVFDGSVYPRIELDADHVKHLAEALDAGATLPPILISKDDRRVVDGWHRANAVRRLRGDDAQIECIEKWYADSSQFFLDAIRHNAKHGRNLSGLDRHHINEVAHKLRIASKAIAGSLGIRADIEGGLSSVPVPQSLKTFPRFQAAPARREPKHYAPKSGSKVDCPAPVAISPARVVAHVSALLEMLRSCPDLLQDESVKASLSSLGEMFDMACAMTSV